MPRAIDHARPDPPPGPAGVALLPAVVGAGLAVALCLLVGWGVSERLFARHLDAQREQAAQRLEFYRLSLESLLARNESLPKLLSLEGKLGALLARPDDKRLRAAADAYLRDVRGTSDIAAAYLMNRDGLTLAASNAGEQGSFVGRNYSFRPYFRDAMKGELGRFYGIGSTTGVPGYFLAARIAAEGGRAGVVAVKVSLDSFEAALLKSGGIVLLSDSSGVIFLSSVREWKYRTLGQLDRETLQRLGFSRQYGELALRPLERGLRLREGPSMVGVALPRDEVRDYLAQSRPVGHLGWKIALLTDMRQERQNASLAGVAAGFATAFLLSVVTYFHLYTKRYRERRQAEAALRQAHLELEQRIAERTSDLVATNLSLEEKIEALKTTEHILRETRDSAVQAGKLTVLGQMSAGISHELNQPLTAIRTFSDNAVHLLARGRLDDVRENLGQIGSMVDRMGRIVNEIKSFSRKSPAERQPMRVADAVRQAVMLVEPRRRQVGARIEVLPFPDDLQVRGDPIRFEQVLVNLIRNGLDAVAGTPEGHVTVTVLRVGAEVRLVIRDNGPGIPEEVLPRLFEPFFTTKSAGQGLGLGLAISRMIVTELGGRLVAGNHEAGGAEFSLVLEEALP